MPDLGSDHVVGIREVYLGMIAGGDWRSWMGSISIAGQVWTSSDISRCGLEKHDVQMTHSHLDECHRAYVEEGNWRIPLSLYCSI